MRSKICSSYNFLLHCTYNCITGFCYAFLSQIYQIIYFLVEKLYLYVSSHHKCPFLIDSLEPRTPYSQKLLNVTKAFCWCSLTQFVFVNTELSYWLAFNKNNFCFSIKTVSTDLIRTLSPSMPLTS